MREEDLEAVVLEVRPSNAAARCLYGSMGFTEVGVRPRLLPRALPGARTR